MATELAPGLMMQLFERLGMEAHLKIREALEPVALAIERQAKINVSSGQHARGTPTPASHGSGPAKISGTLARSITHSSVTPGIGGWEVRIGPAGGLYPYYSKRTASSKYGYYLETGLRNGTTYPWLGPAVHMVNHVAIYSIFAGVFATLS